MTTTLQESQKPLSPLRNLIHAYQVSHLYTKVEPSTTGTEIELPVRKWSAYLMTAKRHYPSWIVIDFDSKVRESKLDYCLVPLDVEKVKEVHAELKRAHEKDLFSIGRDWGCEISTGSKGTEWIEESEYLKKGVYAAPVTRLRDPAYLAEVNWPSFVDSVIAFGTSEKDPRIKLVQKAHLPFGLDISIAPHGVIVTNGGVSKTTFYQIAGENFGKVTAGSFLGFAKSPTEVFPGTINGTTGPIGIDQIADQSAAQIMRFMFNAFERGWDYVSSGAVKFKVETSSTFALLSNTYAVTGAQSSKTFANMLDHISENASIGRRIGLFLYGSDFRRITKKMSKTDEATWKEKVDEYRAVEEFAWERIQGVIHSKNVWDWINSPIDGYEASVDGILASVDDETVQDFLQEHGRGGQTRIRGAAIYAAVVDNLKAIALDRFDESAFLEDAGELLGQFVNNNIESVGKLCAEWQTQVSAQRSMAFKVLPDYMQEIVSAIELWKQRNPSDVTFTLGIIPYVPKKASYRTLNECARKLNGKQDSSGLLHSVKQHFGMDLIRQTEGKWKVMLTVKERITEITPLGQLQADFDKIDDSTNPTEGAGT